MQNDTAELAKLIKLPDPDFFRLDEERQSELTLRMIGEDDIEGSAIASPSVVDLAHHSTMPLIWASLLSNVRQWKVVTPRNSTLVVSDLNTGKITVHDAFQEPTKTSDQGIARSAQGSEAAVPAAGGVGASIRVLDLASVARLPARPGRYALTLLYHDWASNTVKLNVVRARAGGGDDAEKVPQVPKAEMLVLKQKFEGMARARAPAISVAKSGLTPALQGAGIRLAPPVQEPETRRVMLHGVARLPVLAGNMVEGGASGAIVRFSVLVVQIDEPIPQQIEIAVPISAAASLKPGIEVTLPFHVDLEAALRYRLAPATYQIYVFGNEHVAGPYALSIAASAGP